MQRTAYDEMVRLAEDRAERLAALKVEITRLADRAWDELNDETGGNRQLMLESLIQHLWDVTR